MSTGFLSSYPAEFSKHHGRRWLVSSFEAGDVVLHDPFAVSPSIQCLMINTDRK
jgi:phytanoyl-CoA hydroxylase